MKACPEQQPSSPTRPRKIPPTSDRRTEGDRVELEVFQDLMESTYGERDRARGTPATIAWLAEEVGELAKATRKGTQEQQLHELGDVLAWTASLANQLGLSLEAAVGRYTSGCPRCSQIPCVCEVS